MITPSNWQTLAVLPAWIHQANRECKAHLSLAEHRPSCLRSVLREDITAVHAAWDMVKQRLMFGPWGLLCTVFVTVRCLSKATVCPNYMILSSVQGTHIYLFCVTELLIKMMLFSAWSTRAIAAKDYEICCKECWQRKLVNGCPSRTYW